MLEGITVVSMSSVMMKTELWLADLLCLCTGAFKLAQLHNMMSASLCDIVPGIFIDTGVLQLI